MQSKQCDDPQLEENPRTLMRSVSTDPGPCPVGLNHRLAEPLEPWVPIIC